ncbi:MAG TPA: type II secretion system protein [Thermoanaerobacterales bacterium]|nr:type II secretion system protein [Thermoanaerobacterales bacterium]
MINLQIKNEKGFTLIELILAVAILAIIITPMFGLFSETFNNNRIAKGKTEAVALAQSKIEELKTLDFNELSVMVGNPQEEIPISEYPKFNRSVNVSVEEPGLLNIQVKVYWGNGEISLFTLKGDTKL